MVNLAGETIRRETFGHCVGIEKRPIDSLGRSTQHTVEPDDVCGHDYFASRSVVMPNRIVNFLNAAYSDIKNVTSVSFNPNPSSRSGTSITSPPRLPAGTAAPRFRRASTRRWDARGAPGSAGRRWRAGR